MDEKIGFPRLGTMGQLGNQLWQIASSCGVARMNYTQPAFPTDWRYRHVFAVPDEFFDDKARTYPLVHERGEVTSRIDERATIYLQNVSLFDWMERDIRGYFAPRAEIKDTLLVQYPWFYRLDMNKT